MRGPSGGLRALLRPQFHSCKVLPRGVRQGVVLTAPLWECLFHLHLLDLLTYLPKNSTHTEHFGNNDLGAAGIGKWFIPHHATNVIVLVILLPLRSKMHPFWWV
jgi:hypothetical protein